VRPLAVVTGAGRGIGRAVALALAARGADLVLAARSQDELEEVAELVGGATVVAADLATAAGVERVVSALDRDVSILVNNAGATGPYGVSWEVDPAAWERQLFLNVTAIFRLCAAVIPGMLAAGHGRIVNLTSSASLEPLDRVGPYSAAKAAVNMLTRQLAVELEDSGVSVVAFAPGPADTRTYADLVAQPVEVVGERGYERFQRTAASGRLSAPERPAHVIAALAFEPTTGLSGSYIDIDDAYAARVLAGASQSMQCNLRKT
jgi:NAD(P)-dependent dehydrogenase (short-subunit alcohol dehydrogenase family)